MFIGIDIASDGASPVLPYLTRRRLSVVLVSPDRATTWRVSQWTALDCGKDVHDAGTLSITAPLSAWWIAQATADSAFDAVTGWERFSFDVYIDGTLEWSGPIIRRDAEPGMAMHVDPQITFTAETFCQHLASRRSNASTTKADVTYTDQADDIIRQAARNCNGSVSPTGYPGGVSRGDFGSGWTVAVQANTGSAATISVGEQEGGNVWGFMTHVAEKGDCFIWTAETSAGTWQYRVETPYLENDRSASIVLTAPAGSLAGYKLGYTTEDIVNTFAIKGSGSGATQVKTWYNDATSTAARGVYEGDVTLPSASGSTYTDAEGATVLDRYGSPLATVEAQIRDTASARFVFHASSTSGQYGMRDQVTVAVPQIATTLTAVVVGWKIAQQGDSPVVTSTKLGDFRPSVGKQAALFGGFFGSRNPGGWRFRNRSG